jgi:hypothetical protein
MSRPSLLLPTLPYQAQAPGLSSQVTVIIMPSPTLVCPCCNSPKYDLVSLPCGICCSRCEVCFLLMIFLGHIFGQDCVYESIVRHDRVEDTECPVCHRQFSACKSFHPQIRSPSFDRRVVFRSQNLLASLLLDRARRKLM